MAKAKPKPSAAPSLYDRDFFAWTQQQADLLRSAAAAAPDSDLDLENLAEEIESWGKRDRRALLSQSARITEHLLKLEYGRAEEPRPGWENSVDDHRSKARRIVADSPGLKGDLHALLSESYADGWRPTARSLRAEFDAKTLPEECPFSLDQILGHDGWPRGG